MAHIWIGRPLTSSELIRESVGWQWTSVICSSTDRGGSCVELTALVVPHIRLDSLYFNTKALVQNLGTFELRDGSGN